MAVADSRISRATSFHFAFRSGDFQRRMEFGDPPLDGLPPLVSVAVLFGDQACVSWIPPRKVSFMGFLNLPGLDEPDSSRRRRRKITDF